MDFCDVCSAPASLVCSNCLDAVYCSEQCQQRDHPEHCNDCVHPADMDHEQLMEEIHMHVTDADEDHDRDHVKIGSQLIQGGAGEPEDLAQWLTTFLNDSIKRRYNRRRVRHQRRVTRRKIRRSRRERRRDRKGTRQAKALGREKGRLGRTELRTQKNKTQETSTTYLNLKK
jgi:hypothetical protein